MKARLTASAVFLSLFVLLPFFVFGADDYQSVTAVKFKDGSIVPGKVLEADSSTIKIQRPDGVIETRRYQDVESFISGPYTGGRQAPPSPPGTYAPPPPVYPPPPPPPLYAPPPPPPAARAYPRYYVSPSNYLVLKAGFYSPESDELRHFDTGFNGELAFGHYFTRNFALELGAGYFETEDRFRGFSFRDGRFDIKDEIWVVPVTLSLKAALPLNPLEIYAIGGAGAFIINGESKGSFQTTGPFSFSGTNVVFGGHVGGGINWNITSDVFFGIEAKYTWAETTIDKTINGIRYELNADVQGLRATANLGFRF